LWQSLFSSPVKAFNLLVYAEALVDAYLVAEPYEFSPVRFQGDPRISKYLDISTAEDPVVLESNLVGGNQRSTDSSLSSSTTYSVSSRPIANLLVTVKTHLNVPILAMTVLQAFLISGLFCASHLDLQSAL
jgi:hypothetical protein